MAQLKSGKYLARQEIEIVVWPAPDADGDATDAVGQPRVVWQENFDNQGRSLGRERVKDAQGREVVEYLPPDGFVNHPSFDHTDNYVLVDERRQIVRQPNGEAVCIKPGQALVFKADGTVETLPDEYAQYVFGENHEHAEDDEAPAKIVRKKKGE